MKRPRWNKHTIIRLIAAYKNVEGLMLLAVALEAVKLIHGDVGAEAMRLIDLMRVDPNNKYIQELLQKVTGLGNKQLGAIGAGSFFYAALSFGEGIGLLLEKVWAEYLAAIATALFVPLECYEIATKPDALKVVLLFVNCGIVWYLLRRIACEKRERAKAG